MNKRNTVFVGISLIYVQDIFGGVEVATTLKGLCRVVKVKYASTAKAWSRKGVDDEIDVMTGNGSRWRIFEKGVDTIWNRGNPEFGKKIKASGVGFRGMKGSDGRLHAPETQKKRTLADDSAVLRQAGGGDGLDSAYDDYDA